MHTITRSWIVASLALFVSGGIATASTASPEASGAESPSGPWTYVAFGDSWPYGAHCNGCRPFPVLYKEALEATGHRVRFINRTTNGGGAESLLADIRSSEAKRDVISRADIVIIATGMNDLEPAFEAAAAGTCGGADELDCFREGAAALRTWFDDILTEIEDLRGDGPTVIRLVTTSNEFLTDPQWTPLGADFATTSGVAITRMNRDVQCEVAAEHEAACVDLGLALNGADLVQPFDVNTQEGMQAVADVILASGLDELR